MLLPLMLLSSLVLSPLHAVAVEGAAQTRANATATQRMLLKIRIKKGGKTLEHPGAMTETGTEMVLELTEGERKHEVMVFVDQKKGPGYKAEVKYSANGKTVLEENAVLKDKKWTRVSKGKVTVEVHIDTSKKRPDSLELPDGKDPLDGLD